MKNLNYTYKRIKTWYIISSSIIFLEFFVNSQLDVNIYFHPIISFLIYLLLLVNLFFLPLILIIIDIRKEQKNFFIKYLQIILSGIGIGFLTIIILFIFSYYNKSVLNSNVVNIEFSRNKIYVENRVWLESSNHVDVYQIENLLFVKHVAD